MPNFNLVDEKWIPCINSHGEYEEFGLKGVLLNANTVIEIFDPSPLITASLYRLLLAILHRNFGPPNKEEWQNLWQEGQVKWDKSKLADYLSKWHHRFDLFDSRYPFYQCPSIPSSAKDSKGKIKNYAKPIASLTHELASGDNATLFDHTIEENPQAISPAEAARLLVAFQSFAVGGLITRMEGEGPSADNAPMVKGAVVMVKGKNLCQTLMLNLHRYNRDDGDPFDMESDDIPAWERNTETTATDRWPKGYLDLLTWQSRRVKLIPEQDESGQTVVRYVVIMKGDQFPGGFSLYMKEPMLAFGKVAKPGKGQDPNPPVAFREDRALWRDSLTLFQSLEGRPKILGWLSDLSRNGIIPLASIYDLSIMGLVTSRAKISLWRHERLPLPLKYLEDQALTGKLKEALELAEYVGKLFGYGFIRAKPTGKEKPWPSPLWILASELLPKDQNGKVDRDAVKSFVKSLAPDRSYWARLGVPFHRLIRDLAEDRADDGEYGAISLPGWAGEVHQAAWQSFRDATSSLDQSSRTLKAVTLAEDNFGLRLNVRIKYFLEPYQRLEEKGGEV